MNTRETLYIENGKLFVGKISAEALAKKYGTPLYVMDAQYIKDVCKAFIDAMAEYGKGAVAYASKAFATVTTAKIIAEQGLWFDCVSAGEAYLLERAGVDMSKVLFHGNNKTEKEIAFGLDSGVGYFVIDSDSEIENLNRSAAERGVIQKVLMRVNPCVSAHTYEAVQTAAPQSKFGYPAHDGALETAKRIASKSNLELKGLHIHIGSQIYDHSSYYTAVDVMTDLMKELSINGIDTEILDLGGGYGIYYKEPDPEFTPRRYAYTLKNICKRVKSDCEEKKIEPPFLIAEPGRCIVGEAGITLYTVGAVKNFPGIKKYVAVDGGMFENPRYALYGSEYGAVIANKAAEPKTDVVTIAGKCCESGDIVAKDVPLQRAEKGDILAVFSTGAYNYSMASNYNLNSVPPVVLVDGEKSDYIVKPQTYEDLIRNNVVPEWI